MWGQSVYGNSILSIQFCCESKTSLNIKSKEKDKNHDMYQDQGGMIDYIWLEK